MSGDRQESTQQGNGAGSPVPFRLRGDYMVGGVILLFCAVVVGITTTFDEVPPILAQGIPPTQFPRMMVGVIAILAAIMIYQAHGREPKKRKPVPLMVFLSAGVLLAFIAAIEVIGTIPAMFLFCVALPLLWGERRIVAILIFAVVFPAAVYLLFSNFLEVRFPAGELLSLFR